MDKVKNEEVSPNHAEGGQVDPPVIRPTSKKKYMANCMWHIQSSECHSTRKWERDEDIAEAFLIAAESGVDLAHDYLINLVEKAGNGKYKERE